MMVIGGLVLAAIGVVFWLLPDKTPLGRLPGDIHFEKPGFSFHFPIVTCLLISAVLSLIMWHFRKSS